MSWEPIAVVSEEVRSGRVTASSLVSRAFENIEANKDFKAVISVTKDRAMARAKQIDERVKNGDNPGRLAGVPFIAKDNFLTFGGYTTAASNMLKNFEAPFQATAIERLEAEGAICVAKANLDAFAQGGSTENSDFFTTLNPHDKTRVSGGSSGGSAAAVALNIVPFALGTDTGGSIRIPASFCGVMGLKPTYGLVSRNGVIAMASSLDCIGPLAKSAEDMAIVLDVMAGKDTLDSTTIDKGPEGFVALDNDTEEKLTIGVIKEYMGGGLNSDVKKVIEDSITKIKNTGVQIKEVSLPSLSLALASYYVICPAEISSNMSRYDGQRYGYSADNVSNLNESYQRSRSEGFNDEIKRRILIGTYVLSSGYYEAYYKKAQQVRTKIISEFNKVFEDCDFLVGPTTPNVAFKVGQNIKDPMEMYLNDIMTVAANLAGLPAVSLPVGFVDNMPVGLQIMAQSRNDRKLLSVVKRIEGEF